LIDLFAVMKLSTFFLLFLAYSAFANFGNHTPFLKSDGTVWATGLNANGELGDGTTGPDRLYPVQVSDSTTNPITNISAISSGGAHTVFLKSDGTVWATGQNNNGELGDGSTTDKSKGRSGY
jgi:alpha-tubulin suppressor-like RCC1 family protein